MGFGPSTGDPQSGVKAVIDLIDLLYPERSTPSLKRWLEAICEPLLTAHAPLAFDTIARFLSQQDFRQYILAQPGIAGHWQTLWYAYEGSIDPEQLDPDLAWLIHDRLAVLEESARDMDDPPSQSNS
ncbi:hypothetical protein [Sulfobacillus thermosulfidooxidans]|uniref:hypothetical protein n=1 Tax=Sulfobacillus thermosulfidooxidans TaxID=28034 RepID=UPI0002DA447B|nr:hypothetical protein [Sulfobacillus thermosulfidooxidans]